MKNRVIVTGGAGYIGSHTAVELAQSGYTPVLLDNFSNSTPAALDGLREILGFEPEFEQVDCADKSALFAAMEHIASRGTVEGIIHFAAFKAVGESTQEPLKYYANNVASTVHLLEAAAHFNLTEFVFSSSCTVYGQPEHIPVDEEAPIRRAESPYGYTKQACERILADFCASGYPMKAALLRYFNPIGAHPSSKIGELPLGHPNNLIPYLTQAAAGLRDPLTVFGNDYPTPDGTCIRDYIHVMDLARAHVAALQWLKNQPPTCEPFNLGTGQGNSVLEVIQAFERATGVAVPHAIGARRPGDVTAIFADATKAQNVLGWTSEKTLEEALLDAWNWQQALNN
jgi:UDP-glucose 4-epimerase